MGVRMLKSAGAMAGPVISGHFAGIDSRLPFAVAACSALLGGACQILTMGVHEEVRGLLENRTAMAGAFTGMLDNEWQDEYGTPEEIRDLGEYVAQLLTTRHYRWVTYNQQLKNCLSDFFPPLAVESDETHRGS